MRTASAAHVRPTRQIYCGRRNVSNEQWVAHTSYVAMQRTRLFIFKANSILNISLHNIYRKFRRSKEFKRRSFWLLFLFYAFVGRANAWRRANERLHFNNNYNRFGPFTKHNDHNNNTHNNQQQSNNNRKMCSENRLKTFCTVLFHIFFFFFFSFGCCCCFTSLVRSFLTRRKTRMKKKERKKWTRDEKHIGLGQNKGREQKCNSTLTRFICSIIII